EGDVAGVFHLVESGEVSLEVHLRGQQAIRVETVVAGDVIGLSWLFPPSRMHVDGRAASAVATIAFDAARIREAMDRDHHFGYALSRKFLRVAYDRLERVRLQRLDVYRRAPC